MRCFSRASQAAANLRVCPGKASSHGYATCPEHSNPLSTRSCAPLNKSFSTTTNHDPSLLRKQPSKLRSAQHVSRPFHTSLNSRAWRQPPRVLPIRQEHPSHLADEQSNHEVTLSYTPADSWDGLEVVGGERDWDNGTPFQPYKASYVLEVPEEITMAIYRATVEVYTAAIAGESGAQFVKPAPEDLINDTRRVKISIQAKEGSDARSVSLTYPNEEVIANIVGGIKGASHSLAHEKNKVTCIAEGEQASAGHAGPQGYKLKSLRRLLERIGREWLHTPITNNSIKLAIVRRISQLTGKLVPDKVLSDAKSISALVYHLAVPPPPKKLAEELAAGSLSAVSNVKIYSRRVTPIDKERELGRWKVIEKALRQKNLPVVGQH